MKTTRLTNALLLLIVLFLGVLTVRPLFLSQAHADARSWHNYVPITALGAEVAFFDSATGDYLVFNHKQNTLKKFGNLGNAQK